MTLIIGGCTIHIFMLGALSFCIDLGPTSLVGTNQTQMIANAHWPMFAKPNQTSGQINLHHNIITIAISNKIQVGEEWCRLDPYYTEPLQVF